VTRTVVLRLRFDDLSRATRSHTLHEASGQTAALLATARELLAASLPTIRERGITLIGITYTNLSHEDAIQLALPFERSRVDAVDTALDHVREKYGSSSISRAVLLGRDQGHSVPLLPD
jgi:DNA polymerase-4